MKTKLVILGAVLAAIVAGWYFVSPGYSMMQLRNAAEAGDEAALEERVDFPAVRDALKDDLRQRMAAEMGGGDDNILGDAGAALAMGLIDPMIDGFITPEAVAKLVERGELGGPDGREAAPTPSPNMGQEAEQAPEWEITRNGLSGFTARPKSRESGIVEPGSPGLVFERDGLGWRLVEIEVPER